MTATTLRTIYKQLVPSAIRDAVRPLKDPLGMYVSQVIRQKSNCEVMSGPFKGMKYNKMDNTHPLWLLGTYEMEIHPAINLLQSFEFDQIINVGAAEGYYAVGMSLLYPKASIYAFEAQTDTLHPTISKLASENLVGGRIEILGLCRPSDLNKLLEKETKKSLLIMDVEGAEVELLNKSKVSGLARTAVLVEIHDMFVPDCSKIIYERFKNTHKIEKYTTRPRTLNDFPFKTFTIPSWLTKQAVLNFMYESRFSKEVTHQDWFLMLPLLR
ncbi:hypothetical protein [Microseira wollei]|uniref:Methyltransferase FkbM domain-containing protein n=1 Tax=Microseira wollei NIES-4236 TaxID=2530354 RepID=A0AAV3XBL5_9CYAN|nr:hypothetical protein [Microseira wollei]GET40277.1 hypothetical protein MiSe_50860 [Microseira wollei NIES-4236]